MPGVTPLAPLADVVVLAGAAGISGVPVAPLVPVGPPTPTGPLAPLAPVDPVDPVVPTLPLVPLSPVAAVGPDTPETSVDAPTIGAPSRALLTEVPGEAPAVAAITPTALNTATTRVARRTRSSFMARALYHAIACAGAMFVPDLSGEAAGRASS
ncbi:MAG TPA: hypothetical protein VN740_06590 [Solirubrobacteraceae bacterium]|nr:hypothetical protein [Solirubrobacteraceae bacterium]